LYFQSEKSEAEDQAFDATALEQKVVPALVICETTLLRLQNYYC